MTSHVLRMGSGTSSLCHHAPRRPASAHRRNTQYGLRRRGASAPGAGTRAGGVCLPAAQARHSATQAHAARRSVAVAATSRAAHRPQPNCVSSVSPACHSRYTHSTWYTCWHARASNTTSPGFHMLRQMAQSGVREAAGRNGAQLQRPHARCAQAQASGNGVHGGFVIVAADGVGVGGCVFSPPGRRVRLWPRRGGAGARAAG